MNAKQIRSLDLQALMGHVGSDISLLAELVDLFEDYYPSHLECVRTAVASNNAPALREAAHQIKGAISNFYAGDAVAVAQRLENAGRDQDLTNAADDLSQLEANIEVVCRELREFCSTS